MTRRAIILSLLCTCWAFTFAQKRESAPINFGVKGGFSSTIYEVRELSIGGMPINDYMAKSEISSFYTLFARTNLRLHYLQTEVSYNISNYSIEFDETEWNPTAPGHTRSSISTKIIGIEVPLFYGYHILKQGPYGLSFYMGPKAKFILTGLSNHVFEQSPYQAFEESIRPINFSLMMGMGINISRVFFDFSLEYGLHNISNGFTTVDLDDNRRTGDLIFDRRKNVFSFSLGFMF